MSLYAFSGFLDAITSFLLGGFVLMRKPNDKVSKAWAGLTFSVAAFSLAQFLRETASDQQFALIWGGKVLFTAVIGIYISFPHFANRLAKKTVSRWMCVGYVGMMFVFLILVNATNLVIKPYMLPKASFRFYSVPGRLYPIFTSFYLFTMIYGIGVLCRRYRELKSEWEKRQIFYMIAACVIGFGGGSMNFLVDFNINVYPFGNYFIPVYTAVVSYAIVKHRLLDVNVIIRKTLIYSIVMGTLTAVYLGIVTLFARIFAGLTGYQTIFSSAIAALLITSCFQPLRKKVQAFVDRKFFRQYVDREEKLYELSREVITHTTPEAMAQSLIRVLSDTLHPKSAALYLRSREGAGFVLVSEQGEDLPEKMAENNSLANYFMDHPQPFVQQDLPAQVGEPLDTRRPPRKEEAA